MKRGFAPTMKQTPRISEAERVELLGSLEQARAEIAASRYDVVTSASLRAEFDDILERDLTDEELDGDRPFISASQR
jgi:hypothetical protein